MNLRIYMFIRVCMFISYIYIYIYVYTYHEIMCLYMLSLYESTHEPAWPRAARAAAPGSPRALEYEEWLGTRSMRNG